MGSEKVRDYLNGILVPHPFINTGNLIEAESTYSQQGNLAGLPVPNEKLQTTGEQDVGSNLEVRGQTNSLLYRQKDSGEQWFGWEEPDRIHGTVGVAVGDRVSPYPVTLPNGGVLVAVGNDTTKEVEIYGFDGSTMVLLATPTTVQDTPRPALLVLEDRVLLFVNVVYGSAYQLRVLQSEDNGATWQRLSQFAFRDAQTSTTDLTWIKTQIAETKGQISLIIWMRDTSKTQYDGLFQFASSDGGMSFEFITRWSGADEANMGAHFALAVKDGFFHLFSARTDTTETPDNFTTQTTYADAFTPIVPPTFKNRVKIPTTSNGVVTLNAGTLGCPKHNVNQYDAGFMTSWVDGDYLYLAVFSNDGFFQGPHVWKTTDLSLWFPVTGRALIDPFLHYPAVLTNRVVQGAATFYRGRTLFFFKGNNIIQCLLMGGYTDLTDLAYISGEESSMGTRLEGSWFPMDLPDNMGWAKTSTGASTATLGLDGLAVVSNGADNLYYDVVPTNFGITEITFAGEVTDGSLQIYVEDNQSKTKFSSVLSSVAFTVGAVNQAMSGLVHIKIYLATDGSIGRVFWRAFDLSNEQTWVDAGTFVPTPDAGIIANLVRVGKFSGNLAATWRFIVPDHRNDFQADIAVDGNNNPLNTLGRPLSVKEFAYLTDGVSTKHIEGEVYRGDTFEIKTRYSKGLANLFCSSSPQDKWCTTDTSMTELVFDLGEGSIGNNTIGVHLVDPNFSTIKIELYQAGAWVEYADVDLSYPAELDAFGSTLKPITSGINTNSRYVNYNEIKQIELSNGIVLDCLQNTEGNLSEGPINQKRPTFWVDGIPVGGSSKLRFKQYLLMIRLNGNQEADKIRFTINPTGAENDPPEGYWCLGQLNIGYLVNFGITYTKSRNLSYRNQIERIDLPGGRNSTIKRGPQQKTVQVAWVGGAPQEAYRQDWDPDYMSDGDQPVSAAYDTPIVLSALHAENKPFTYLAVADKGDTTLLRGEEGGFFWAKFQPTSFNIATLEGVPGGKEVLQLGNVTIVEEL